MRAEQAVMGAGALWLQELRQSPGAMLAAAFGGLLLTFASVENAYIAFGVVGLMLTDTMVGGIRAVIDVDEAGCRRFEGDRLLAGVLGKIARLVLAVVGGACGDIVLIGLSMALDPTDYSGLLVKLLTPTMKLGLASLAAAELLSLAKHAADLDMPLATVFRGAAGAIDKARREFEAPPDPPRRKEDP